MTIFTDDFSGLTPGVDAKFGQENDIAGWTFGGGGAGSEAFQSVTVVDLGGGARALSFADSGWGQGMMMRPTSIGSLGAATQTEILVKWLVANTTATHPVFHLIGAPIMRSSVVSGSGNRHVLGFRKEAGTNALQQQLWYAQAADDWVNTGGIQTVTGTFVAGDWWWTRLFVNTSNQWQWKTWKDGTSEPGYFIGLTANTAQTAGYPGVGIFQGGGGYGFACGYFSIGTSGDAPVGPGGAPAPDVDGEARAAFATRQLLDAHKSVSGVA